MSILADQAMMARQTLRPKEDLAVGGKWMGEDWGGEVGGDGEGKGGRTIIMALVRVGVWSQCNMRFVRFPGLHMQRAANHPWRDTVSSRLEIFCVLAVNSLADAS